MFRFRMTRETRLLVATVVVSTAVVLVLSTLRFPETPRIAEAPPAPLERLAASAAYEQLARSVERVSRRVASDLFVVRTASSGADVPRGLADLLQTPLTYDRARHLPALRLTGSRAVLAADVARAGDTLHDQQGRPLPVIAVDALRRLTVVAVPESAGTQVGALTLSELQTPTYVVVAEGTAAGVAFRPVFVGSADRFSDPRWDRQLLAVSGTALTAPGALVFSLEGQFIGAAVVQATGTLAFAGAAEVIAAATELSTRTLPPPVDFGITVQALSPDLADALAAPHGVVVAFVAPGGLLATRLQATDVITAINGVRVDRPDDALAQLARASARGSVQLEIVRHGEEETVTLPLPPGDQGGPAAAAEQLGLDHVPGIGSLVTNADSTLARAGVRAGDVIVRVDRHPAPAPAQVLATLRMADEDGLVLVIRRDGIDRVVAVAVRRAR